MSWVDVVLPFTWWQRVLIGLAVLMFSPLLVAGARLLIAGIRLAAGASAIVVRRACIPTRNAAYLSAELSIAVIALAVIGLGLDWPRAVFAVVVLVQLANMVCAAIRSARVSR